jgi:predicted DNA-binding protein (UPF0251 family)
MTTAVRAKEPNTRTFSSETDRDRLTPTALKAVQRLANKWKLTGNEAAALLGVSPSTWDRVVQGKVKKLTQDQMTRVSALVGIFKGLHLLFVNDMADRWPSLRNRGPLFNNQSPVELMIDGGIPAMLDVRRHVDALRGGL